MQSDKGKAAPLKFEGEVPNGGNIGVPSDAVGYSVESKVVSVNLTSKGNANDTGGTQSIVGSKGAM